MSGPTHDLAVAGAVQSRRADRRQTSPTRRCRRRTCCGRTAARSRPRRRGRSGSSRTRPPGCRPDHGLHEPERRPRLGAARAQHERRLQRDRRHPQAVHAGRIARQDDAECLRPRVEAHRLPVDSPNPRSRTPEVEAARQAAQDVREVAASPWRRAACCAAPSRTACRSWPTAARRSRRAAGGRRRAAACRSGRCRRRLDSDLEQPRDGETRERGARLAPGRAGRGG